MDGWILVRCPHFCNSVTLLSVEVVLVYSKLAEYPIQPKKEVQLCLVHP